MKIVFIGNNTMAAECLEYAAGQGADIAGVVPEPGDDGRDGWQRSLKKAALGLGIRVMQPGKLTDPAFLEELRDISPDIIFSVQCRRILRKELIDLPGHGAINLHLSLLPRYRGCYPVAWAIINGERKAGVTLHYIDEGIDTGDIIAQKEVDVRERESARELFDRLGAAGLELFREQFSAMISLENKRVPQDDSKSLYYPLGSIDFKENRIDWSRSHTDLHNWIRGYMFPPFQYPYFMHGDDRIEVAGIGSPRDLGKEPPGKVSSGEAGITVSCGKGSIVIEKVNDNGTIADAKDFAMKMGIGEGTVLK